MNNRRTAEIIHFVQEHRNFVWEPYDQGRWSWSLGHPRSSNPHIVGHVNRSDWHRGWDVEESRL